MSGGDDLIARLRATAVYRAGDLERAAHEAADRIEKLEAENTELIHDLKRCMARESAALNRNGNDL